MTEFLSTADGRIAAVASRQHGFVTTAQLAEAGIDKDGITWRVRTGRLHRLHRGVYAVGHRSLTWRGRWLAAVLAAGDGAVLSHSSAAALWGFLRPIQGLAHVTVGAAVHRSARAGIVIHRSRTITRRDVTRRHGIAVTTPARTIEDIRGSVAPYLFRRALRQAELAGHRVPYLAVTRRTRSDLELLFFLALCDALGYPRPEQRRCQECGSTLVNPLLGVMEGDGRPALAQQSAWPARTQTRRRGRATSSGRGRRRARRGPVREGERCPTWRKLECPGWPTHPSSS